MTVRATESSCIEKNNQKVCTVIRTIKVNVLGLVETGSCPLIAGHILDACNKSGVASATVVAVSRETIFFLFDFFTAE